MKLVHLCLVGAYNEGWTYQENLLSKYHARLGYDVTLLCIPLEYHEGKLRVSNEVDYVNKEGVHVIRMPEKINIKNRIVFHNGVTELLDRISPDIVFIHGCQFWDIGEVTRYLKKHPDITAYVDNHADFSNSATNWLTKNILHKVIWRYGVNRIEPYVKKFYGVLPARVDFLTDVYHLPKEKCELLVMGADDELVEKVKANRSRELIRDKFGIHSDDFLVMTGGKINHNRPETLNLMRAVLDSENKHIKLIVFGVVADELKNQFDELLRSDRIQFVGWLDSELTYEYMDAADLIVFPGLHSVMWEQAVGMGVPCIFKKIPGFDHVDLGGNAAFVDDTSSDSLKKVIEAIVSNPERYGKMRTVARDQGMKVFSYRDIAKRCIEIY